MSDPRREFAASIVSTLRGAGHQALFAGGCVRDLLLGEDPADYDVATDATPHRVMVLFRRTVPVGVSFGVVRVLGPKGAGPVEVATFRSDGAYLDGRRPESVAFADARADALRRDFTINGMFLDPISGEVLDYVGGRDDIAGRLIRAIGNPEERFGEDKLRILRAVRFAARLGFDLDRVTASAMARMVAGLRQVSVERIAVEFHKMLVHPSRVRALELARRTGILDMILPGLPADEGEWRRTLRAMDALPRDPSFTLAMAIVLRGPSGGEAAASARVADVTARDWKLSNDERERIAWLVGHQTSLVAPQRMTRSSLKRLLAKPGIDDLLSLHRAMAAATTGDASHVDYCEDYLRTQPEGPIDPPPLVTGHDLIARGIRPGPGFARILDAVRDAQLEGAIREKDEALQLALAVNP